MAKTVIFTADDLGLDESANLAIERAHRDGVLNAACLMMGQPGTAQALEIIRRNPSLEIGWHLHVCDSKPLTRDRWPWGSSPVRAGLALAFSPGARKLAGEEILAQWEQLVAAGVECRFLNGHHHLHIHPFVARTMRRVVPAGFAGWVRGFQVRYFSGEPAGRPALPWLRRGARRWLKVWPAGCHTDSLWGLDRTFRMDAAEIARVLPALPDGRHEFVFHPRRDGDADQRALLALKTAPAA